MRCKKQEDCLYKKQFCQTYIYPYPYPWLLKAPNIFDNFSDLHQAVFNQHVFLQIHWGTFLANNICPCTIHIGQTSSEKIGLTWHKHPILKSTDENKSSETKLESFLSMAKLKYTRSYLTVAKIWKIPSNTIFHNTTQRISSTNCKKYVHGVKDGQKFSSQLSPSHSAGVAGWPDQKAGGTVHNHPVSNWNQHYHCWR